MSLISIKKYFFNSFLYFFIIFNLSNFYSYASGKNNNQTNLINKISKSSSIITEDVNFNEEYILDSGDVLSFYFEGLDIFSNVYSIDRDGNLNLPEIGNYYARGKTISEITSALNKKYEEFIYEPNLEINVSAYRRIKVFITGEVNNPGLHDLNANKEVRSVNQLTNSLPNKKISGSNFPKLFDALLVGEGVTNFADLSQIQVIRNNSTKNGGGKRKR